MNDKIARKLLMEHLYNEISAADKKKLKTYLEGHPEMKQELDELRQTRSLLQQAPEVEPQKELVIAEPSERSFAGWWHNAKTVLPRSGWGKTALATAACLVLLLVAGAVVDLNIQSTKAGFSISFGEMVQPKTSGLTEGQANAIVDQIQQENAAILTEYADMLNQHNRQQLQQVVQHFERQRANDLQLIDQALNQYQQKTESQITQTQQVLGEVIQTMAATNQQ